MNERIARKYHQLRRETPWLPANQAYLIAKHIVLARDAVTWNGDEGYTVTIGRDEVTVRVEWDEYTTPDDFDNGEGDNGYTDENMRRYRDGYWQYVCLIAEWSGESTSLGGVEWDLDDDYNTTSVYDIAADLIAEHDYHTPRLAV